jgi:hypothetical protein
MKHIFTRIAKDLVPSVLDGSMSLQAAYRQAAARKEAQETAAVPTAQELRDRGIDEHNRRAWSQMRPR